MNLHMRLLVLIALFFLMLVDVSAQSAGPKIPLGLSWHDSKYGVGSFLRPDNWYVKEEVQKDTKALFITREEITDESHFLVGFSVNKIQKIRDKVSQTPNEYARTFALNLSKTGELLLNRTISGNAADMQIVRIKKNIDNLSIVVHYIVLGIDSDDAVYVLFFEAPETEWDQQFSKNGRHMLNLFSLDIPTKK